jgi:hypothetical protein
VNKPTTIIQPTVARTPISMTTARRPIDSMSRQSSVAIAMHTDAASRLWCNGVIVVQRR